MNKSELHGVIVPLITPVDRDDRVDEESLRKLVRFLLDAGVHGLLAGGSSSEAPLLTADQWGRMMEIVFDEAKDAVPLIGGAMETSTNRIIERIHILAQIGYSNFAVTPSYYISLKTDDEFLRLYGRCKEAIGDNEMIVYNIPSCVGSSLSVKIICEMAERGWTQYCKDSSGDFVFLKNLINNGSDINLKVFYGGEAFVPEALLCGVCGIMAITSNYEPQTFVQAYNAAVDHNTDELLRLNKRILLLRELLFLAGSCWISGTKYAVSTLGKGNGKPVCPLQPLNQKQKNVINRLEGDEKCLQREKDC